VGDYAKAEPLFLQTLEIQKQTLGEKHPGLAVSLLSVARLYVDMGDYAKAEPSAARPCKSIATNWT